MNLATLAGKVTLHRGQSYKSALLDEPGPVLLGLGTIARNGGFNPGGLRTYGGESPSRILVRPGDLYLSLKDVTHKAELLGAVARVPDSIEVGRLTQDTVKLEIISDTIDPNYLYWLLQSPDYRKYCRAHGTGTTNLDLSRVDFLSYPFWLPSLPEQQAIAEVLGALDDKIAANTRLAATAESFGVAYFHAQASEPTLLAELVALQKTTIDPAAIGTATVDHYSLPAFDTDQLPITEPADQIRSNKFLIDRDVVLLSKLNPRFPRVWRANCNSERPALASTEFLVLDPQGVSREILWAVLAQSSFAGALDAKVAGTSGSHQRVKPADALATPVLDPRRMDPAKARVIESALLLATEARLQNRTLAAARDALLPKLMSGQLRVQDPPSEVGVTRQTDSEEES